MYSHVYQISLYDLVYLSTRNKWCHVIQWSSNIYMYMLLIDILITCIIENEKYHTTIFYKRDNFSFNVVNF